MAGDWIKMRSNIKDDPDVVVIAGALVLDEFAVVGRLHAVWSWLDQHSKTGTNVRITSAYLDRLTACPGFADALRGCGWLRGDDGNLEFPNFDRHNGDSAKRRATETKRKKEDRDKCPQESGQMSGKNRTREEKSREESLYSNSGHESAAIPPVTLDVVLANCGQYGATREMAERWWQDRDGVGWLEKGQLITRWQSNLSSYAGKWKNNEARYKPNGNNSRPNRQAVTRNHGPLDPARPSLNATAFTAGSAGGVEGVGGPGPDDDGKGGW